MKLELQFSRPLNRGAAAPRLKTGVPRTLSCSQSRIRVAVNLALGARQAIDPLRNAHMCALPLRVAEIEDFDGNSISGPNTYRFALLHRVPLKRDATLPDVVLTFLFGKSIAGN